MIINKEVVMQEYFKLSVLERQLAQSSRLEKMATPMLDKFRAKNEAARANKAVCSYIASDAPRWAKPCKNLAMVVCPRPLCVFCLPENN